MFLLPECFVIQPTSDSQRVYKFYTSIAWDLDKQIRRKPLGLTTVMMLKLSVGYILKKGESKLKQVILFDIFHSS